MDDREDLPPGFTVGLAAVDAVPVLLFCGSALALAGRVDSVAFVLGAVLAAVGGVGKVVWKFVIACARKNVPLLSRQMRITLPVGFLLMMGGALAAGTGPAAVAARLSAASWALLGAWLACMVAMGVLAVRAPQSDAASNWVEQLVNIVGQAALLGAILVA